MHFLSLFILLVFLFFFYFLTNYLLTLILFLYFFFFQAEDGIRDIGVLEFRRVLFRSVKCAYSSAQVGSGDSIVMRSSGGLPLGKTLRRWVNVLGPHLHKPSIWALPSSP